MKSDSPGIKKEGDTFFKWLYNRVMKKNKNAIITTLGATGSGKSWSNLRIAEKATRINLNKDFDPRNITFTPREAMERINSGELIRGDVIIMEEIGVSASSREWWSITNIMLSYLTQTFREKGYVLLMNTPDLSFIDKNIRKLTHCILTTQGINFRTNTTKVVPKILQVNHSTGKVYYKFMRSKRAKVQGVNLQRPSQPLIDYYEVKKKEYVDKLNEKIEKKILVSEEKEKKADDKVMGNGVTKEFTSFQAKLAKLADAGLSTGEIAKELQCAPSKVSRNKGYMINKGHKFKEKP